MGFPKLTKVSIIVAGGILSFVLYANRYKSASDDNNINRLISVFQVISLMKPSKFDLNELLTMIKPIFL